MKFKIIEREVIIETTTDYLNPTLPTVGVRYELYKWGDGIYFDEKLKHDTVGKTWVFINNYEDRETAKRCATFISQVEKITPNLKISSEEFEL